MGNLKPETLLGLDSRGILVIFLAVALLTLGFSFVGGPDPRVKIYILAEEQTADLLSLSMKSKISSEVVFYYPKIEFNDLDVLIHTKTIRTILIADFPFIFSDELAFERFLEDVVVPAERVIIVASFEECRFASAVMGRLPQKIEIMSELEICDEIRGMVRETGRSYSLYEFFLKSAGFSSLALVGAGAAFCNSRILESGYKGLLRGICEGILITGLTFILIQGVYLTSSTILETPISLHTTASKITAVSLLGPFGGGTVPRIIFAALGLALGALSASKRVNLKISPVSISIAVLGLSLLLGVGLQVFGERNLLGVLLLHYGYKFYEIFYRPISYDLFAIGCFKFSRGTMLVFPGLVPMGVVPRMKSRLHITVIPFCIVVGSWGLMRVGNMRLDVALNSFVPGIALAILSSALIISLDRVLALIGDFISKSMGSTKTGAFN